MTQQKTLPLPPPAREKAVLVRVDSVQTQLGLSEIEVSDLADSGQLRWVFDFNNGARKKRELRFLAAEVFAPELTKRVKWEGVVKIILGTQRESFRGAEIARRLRVTSPTVHYFHKGGDLPGEIVGKTLHVSRAALESFLRKRLVTDPVVANILITKS